MLLKIQFRQPLHLLGWDKYGELCQELTALGRSRTVSTNSLIEAGFDILNPVQCSATNMDPQQLKDNYGDRITFWGGGVDTQHVLPFGTSEEVAAQVRKRVRIFGKDGGFVFNPIHNVQAAIPRKICWHFIIPLLNAGDDSRWAVRRVKTSKNACSKT